MLQPKTIPMEVWEALESYFGWGNLFGLGNLGTGTSRGEGRAALHPALHPTWLLLAGVHIIDSDALLAADIAAPVEDAVAFLFPLLRPRVVATATAQQIAAIDAMGGDIASPVPGAKGARLWVGLTKVGGVLIVD